MNDQSPDGRVESRREKERGILSETHNMLSRRVLVEALSPLNPLLHSSLCRVAQKECGKVRNAFQTPAQPLATSAAPLLAHDGRSRRRISSIVPPILSHQQQVDVVRFRASCSSRRWRA